MNENSDKEKMMAEFYEMVDKFVFLANELSETQETTRISSVIMFAAARYNAFNFFITDGAEQKERQAIDYYTEQYKLMLQDNFDETRNVYLRSNETKS
jgi:pyocin large subunit-like protein